MKTKQPLAYLSERQLLERFDDIVRRDRHNTARLLAYIAEIDERKIWAKYACSSMFAFCMQRFHMSESMTAKRIWAARTARRFPVILTMVTEGELHLSGINLLGKHLTDANHRAILARAKHKSSREIEILVAELAPRPDVPSRVRALPGTTGRAGRADAPLPAGTRAESGAHRQGVPGGAAGDGAANESRGTQVGASGSEPYGGTGNEAASEPRGRQADASSNVPGGATCAFPTASPADFRASRPAFRKPITALAPRRYKIEITVDQDIHDRLRALQDLLRHEFPSADPALIVSRAIELLLDHTLKKKAALTDNGRSKDGSDQRRTRNARTDGEPSGAEPTSREQQSNKANRAEPTRVNRTRVIPAAIRREVWKRDLGRCTFVDEQGRRCRETGRIEYHHEVPYGKGGGHDTGNIALRCRAHNQYQANLDFGRDFMRRKRTVASLHSARNVGHRHAEERDEANARAVSVATPSTRNA